MILKKLAYYLFFQLILSTSFRPPQKGTLFSKTFYITDEDQIINLGLINLKNFAVVWNKNKSKVLHLPMQVSMSGNLKKVKVKLQIFIDDYKLDKDFNKITFFIRVHDKLILCLPTYSITFARNGEIFLKENKYVNRNMLNFVILFKIQELIEDEAYPKLYEKLKNMKNLAECIAEHTYFTSLEVFWKCVEVLQKYKSIYTEQEDKVALFEYVYRYKMKNIKNIVSYKFEEDILDMYGFRTILDIYGIDDTMLPEELRRKKTSKIRNLSKIKILNNISDTNNSENKAIEYDMHFTPILKDNIAIERSLFLLKTYDVDRKTNYTNNNIENRYPVEEKILDKNSKRKKIKKKKNRSQHQRRGRRYQEKVEHRENSEEFQQAEERYALYTLIVNNVVKLFDIVKGNVAGWDTIPIDIDELTGTQVYKIDHCIDMNHPMYNHNMRRYMCIARIYKEGKLLAGYTPKAIWYSNYDLIQFYEYKNMKKHEQFTIHFVETKKTCMWLTYKRKIDKSYYFLEGICKNFIN